MWYVYFLISNKKKNYVYVGSTGDLKRRMVEHNSEASKRSTAPYRPLKLYSYIAVPKEKLARDLEQYFKKGSGKAFLRKRILPDEALA